MPIIVYGRMTDDEGRPIAVDVYRGNTGDPSSVVDQVNKLRERFQWSRVVLVGNRGVLAQPQIEKLKAYPQMGWITTLTSVAIRGLLAEGSLQLSLTLVIGQAESGGDSIAGISRRALDGLLQPSAGRGAATQARGVIGGDRESVDQNRERSWSDARTSR